MKYANVKRWQRIAARRYRRAAMRHDERKNKRALIEALLIEQEREDAREAQEALDYWRDVMGDYPPDDFMGDY